MKNAHSRFNLIVVIVALTRCQHTQARVAEFTFFVVNLFVNGKKHFLWPIQMNEQKRKIAFEIVPERTSSRMPRNHFFPLLLPQDDD